MKLIRQWEQLRYLLLDRVAARGTGGSTAYSLLVPRVEETLHQERRQAAADRISRALSLPRSEALSIYRQCLTSEASEEADSARLLRSGAPTADCFAAPAHADFPCDPCIYISLHWGSPMLAFLYLRCTRGIPLRLIGRPLDDHNPLPPAKMAWGRKKVAWMETLAESPFLPDDGRGALEAREELLEGRSIFASADVPATAGRRSCVIDLFDERIRIASGLLRLAALTKVPLVPVLGYSRNHQIHIETEDPIPAGTEDELAQAVGLWIRRTLQRRPGDWWLWPFVQVEAT